MCHRTPDGLLRLPDLPAAVLSRLTNLRKLKFSSHGLATVGSELEALTQLEALKLHGGHTLRITVSADLGRLPALQEVAFRRCHFAPQWPAGQPLRGLWLVILDRCRFEAPGLPLYLAQASGLHTLHLLECSSLPAAGQGLGLAHLSGLQSLQELSLCNCILPAWPAELWALTKLTTLNVSSTAELLAVPADISRLTALRTLVLQGDREDAPRLLSTGAGLQLPAEISRLSSLEYISFQYGVYGGGDGLFALAALPALRAVRPFPATPQQMLICSSWQQTCRHKGGRV